VRANANFRDYDMQLGRFRATVRKDFFVATGLIVLRISVRHDGTNRTINRLFEVKEKRKRHEELNPP